MSADARSGKGEAPAQRRNERILVVEDEKLLRWSLRERLLNEGFQVAEADCGEAARRELERSLVDLVLLDFKLPDTTGLDILRELRESGDETNVILMTAYSSVEQAVEAMRIGAYTYLTKPFDLEELIVTIDKALEESRLRREVRHLRASRQAELGLDTIIADSEPMKAIFDAIVKIARSPTTTVLLTGESGVGKDLLAKALHHSSDRSSGPFMNITCTTITESLLESELFGHEKGAFTDARSSRKGLFELADGGTVFLDEIGDMPLALQAKLLRFLQEKTFKRVGGSEDVTVDVRIIAATNKDLQALVDSGEFRKDLYFRLDVIQLKVPPLRERVGDVPLIAQSFVDQYNRAFRKSVKGLSPAALSALEGYEWPGNVRELKNVIERAMILGEGEWIEPRDLPFVDVSETADGEGAGGSRTGFVLPAEGVDLEQLERSLIEQALERTRGVKTKAGTLLGMNRDQIRYRMDKYGIVFEG